LHAGDHTDHPTVDELVLHTPLVVSGPGTVDLQLAVHPCDETGRRRFTIHARAHTSEITDGLWIPHASGHLALTSAERPAASATGTTTWPPPGAHPIDLDGFYPDRAKSGYQYGPAFQGLTAAWRHGQDIYAEVELPQDSDTTGYGIHPALLDP